MATKLQDHTFEQESTDPTLRSELDLFVEPLFLIDRSHRIVLANKSAQTTMRLPESALLRQHIETMISFTLPARRKSSRIKLPTAKPLTVAAEVYAIEHSATFFPITSVTYFRELKPRPVALVILRPIASLQLSDQTTVSDHFQLIGQLAMLIAHDLSNALTSIIGNAQLHREQLDGDFPELDDVIRKSDEMAQFITELKKYGRQPRHTTHTLDLNTSVNETLTVARNLLGRTIQIDFLPCDKPTQIYINPLRLHQILLSILINSKDAMPSGGSITIETDHATLDREFTSTHPGARLGNYSRLSVTDRSAGMDSQHLSRIFDLPPADETLDASNLGLPIVYSIVKAFGGYIDVESWPGKGTRYDIYIPKLAPSRASSTAERLPHSVESQSHESTSLNNNLILVADDDLAIQRTIDRYVSKAGFRTIFSADGREALASYRQLAAERNQPTLLIADLGLPGIDGRTLSVTIQDEFPSAHILLTSGFEIELINGKTEDGFDFLQKPFERHHLTAIIERILSLNNNHSTPNNSVKTSTTNRRRKT